LATDGYKVSLSPTSLRPFSAEMPFSTPGSVEERLSREEEGTEECIVH
jgi:hypothetical protein